MTQQEFFPIFARTLTLYEHGGLLVVRVCPNNWTSTVINSNVSNLIHHTSPANLLTNLVILSNNTVMNSYQRQQMHSDIYKDTAIKYHVEDLAGALIPGSRLSNILKELENGRSNSNYTHDFLFKNGLYALLRYAKNETSFAEFLRAAEPEQSARRRFAKERALEEQAEQNLQQEALQARMKLTQERMAAEKRAFDKNPKNKARAKQFELREKYNLSLFIDKDDFPKLMDILRRVDKGVRLPEDDFIGFGKTAMKTIEHISQKN